ncbi:hypothetical protein BDN70DRAFT_881281 [Pholiota conissans]|uniref:Uncharacterized protein n=1 Tax=Pholiota conissans TaxID=109636 RepID=A0A9P5Z0S1_9AGAR|nr:hypothetical protein BDN70DRAFT_881281 [Pholiota conissans]
MVHSPLLDSFNPFVTHPFTNSSGIIPQPPPPSAYPLPIPAAFGTSRFDNDELLHMSISPSSISMSSSVESTIQDSVTPSPIHTPQPRRRHPPLRSPSSPISPSQIFVPFRRDASSPDLKLKKKASTSTSDATKTSMK